MAAPSHIDVVKALAIAVQTPSVGGNLLGLPVLLWGAPGVGKTARINEIAAALGFWKNDNDGIPRNAANTAGGTGGCVTVLASIRTPEDFLGVPVPIYDPELDPERDRAPKNAMAAALEVRPPNTVKYMPPDWALELNANSDNPDPTGRWNRENAQAIREGKVEARPVVPVGTGRKAMLFLDEFSTAPPSVQAALLRVVHERVVGDVQLNSNVVVVAAANPPAMSPGGKPLAPPTVNRFIHMWWASPTKREWGDYMCGKAKDYQDMILAPDASGQADKLKDTLGLPLVYPRDFAANWPFYACLGADFVNSVTEQELSSTKSGGAMKFHPDNAAPLFNMPPASEMSQTAGAFDVYRYAWPSPRSWEIALRAVAACRAAKEPDLMEMMICGSVGDPLCQKFADHVRSQNIKTPEEYLLDHKAGKFVTWGKVDATNTIVTNMVQYGIANPDLMGPVVDWLIENTAAVRGNKGLDLGQARFVNSMFENWVRDWGAELKRTDRASFDKIDEARQEWLDHHAEWHQSAAAQYHVGGLTGDVRG